MNNMRSCLLILVMSILPLFFISAYASDQIADAHLFKLQDTDQDLISLSSYINKKPVVLMFWTTWSPMSESELRSLNNSYASLSGEGIEVLAIDSGELPDTVDNFIQDLFLAYRVLLDKDSSVTRNYNIEGYPTYVLINKAGKLVFSDSYFPMDKYKKLLLSDEGG